MDKSDRDVELEKDEDIYSVIKSEDGTIIHTINNIAVSWTKRERINEQQDIFDI